MVYEKRKLSMEQWFFATFFALSIILSFLFGYLFFRYWEVEICKSPIRLVGQDELANVD